MNIKEKILEFRKQQCQGVPSKAPMRLTKEESIEFIEFNINYFKKMNESLSISSVDPEIAIKFAREDGLYGMVSDIIKGSMMFGISLHPDWSEFKSSPLYY